MVFCRYLDFWRSWRKIDITIGLPTLFYVQYGPFQNLNMMFWPFFSSLKAQSGFLQYRKKTWNDTQFQSRDGRLYFGSVHVSLLFWGSHGCLKWLSNLGKKLAERIFLKKWFFTWWGLWYPIEKCHFLHFHSSASNELRYKKSMTVGKLLKRGIWCKNPHTSIFIRLRAAGEQSYISYDTPIEKCLFFLFYSSASNGFSYNKSMTVGKLLKRGIWCKNPHPFIFIRLRTAGEQS